MPKYSENKSYKISTFYIELSKVCDEIFGRSKLTEYLIVNLLNYPELKHLPLLKKGKFTIMVIDQMVKNSFEIFREGKTYITDLSLAYSSKKLDDERIDQLRKIYVEHNKLKNVVFNVRFEQEDKAMIAAIEELATKSNIARGRVIEQALGYFLVTCDKKLYDLIKLSFEISLLS